MSNKGYWMGQLQENKHSVMAAPLQGQVVAQVSPAEGNLFVW